MYYISYFLFKEKAFLFFFLQMLFAFLHFHCMELFPLEMPHLFHVFFLSYSYPLAPVTAFFLLSIQLCDQSDHADKYLFLDFAILP